MVERQFEPMTSGVNSDALINLLTNDLILSLNQEISLNRQCGK
jgi:hypothetical protein